MKQVKKVWGTEDWLVNTNLYCGKILVVKPLSMCSLHRHLVKDETFYVMLGKVTLEFGKKTRYLSPGDSERIRPRLWHRFANHAKLPAVILEVSTHHDDRDVERKEPSRKIQRRRPRHRLRPISHPTSRE